MATYSDHKIITAWYSSAITQHWLQWQKEINFLKKKKILISNKRDGLCEMIHERRLQSPVFVVLSTMQNKDQCDERRSITSKPIFCTLLSHTKKPFNPFYLTMPAVSSPTALFHSD